jgi:phenylalanyl-tRNA synthetase beta chain
MKLPVSWIKEFAPVQANAREIAAALINAGLEVEGIETVGAGVSGTLVIGRVVEIEELAEFKKPIRWCQVDIGTQIRGIVCGATNFAVGDHVVVAEPGVTLPGDFTITSRETYGHVSDGMICSEREIGLGQDHAGILVLDGVKPGQDANDLLGIGEEVLDIAVTPDRGYALSVRGVAREVATAFGVEFRDPALNWEPDLGAPESGLEPRDCIIEDFSACELLTLRTVLGFNPDAPTPRYMVARLQACGIRSISLAVDVTNYVMLELGQPTHAFDLEKIRGPVRVRRANVGESLETLDHVVRNLSPLDSIIADSSGPIGLAGTMGGLTTEIDATTTSIALEAAFFPASTVAGNSRRHKISSEASRRFERGIDRELAPIASARACALLIAHGGGSYAGMCAVESPMSDSIIEFDLDLPTRTAGMVIDHQTVIEKLDAIGATYVRTSPDICIVNPPSWRPDLTQPADLVEEVVRLVGYEKLPSTLPSAPAGRGLTHEQRLRRRIGNLLAGRGMHEIRAYPFIGVSDFDAMRFPENDLRRETPTLVNPLSDLAPQMRSTLLPGMLSIAARNVGRGENDLALFEIGSVFLGGVVKGGLDPGVDSRPSESVWEQMQVVLPAQPEHLGVVITGAIESVGVWGNPRAATWRDSIDAVLVVADELGVDLEVHTGNDPSFHPGRCAEIVLKGTSEVVGSAGELHPAVIEHWNLPRRSCAAEVDLSVLLASAVNSSIAPAFSNSPVAKEDLAFVVTRDRPVAEVEACIRAAGGELLESIRLFDVYEGDQIPESHKSLAFALRFRGEGQTLAPQELQDLRNQIITAVSERVGGTLR